MAKKRIMTALTMGSLIVGMIGIVQVGAAAISDSSGCSGQLVRAEGRSQIIVARGTCGSSRAARQVASRDSCGGGRPKDQPPRGSDRSRRSMVSQDEVTQLSAPAPAPTPAPAPAPAPAPTPPSAPTVPTFPGSR